jgi:hypothetical protein
MAYGINAPFGLQPRQSSNGSTWNGQLSEYLINPAYTTAIFNGDPVALLNNGTIGRGVPGAPIAGVFFGCKYILGGPGQGIPTFSPYWPGNQTIQANTSVTALVLDDRNVLYDVQASNSNPTTTTAAALPLGVPLGQLNQNANFAIGGVAFTDAIVPQNPAAGSTISGTSGFYLDCSTISNAATSNLKIIRLTPRPGNVFYTAIDGVGITPIVTNTPVGAFNNVIVSINNNVYNGGTGTPGGTLIVQNGTLTAAQIIAAFAVPLELVAAPVAGLAIMVNSFTMTMSVAPTAPFTGGGITGLQYGNTANLGGTLATSTNPAAMLTTGSFGPFTFTGVPRNPALVSAEAITFSNQTAAYATGTAAVYNYVLNYSVIPV